MPLRPWMMPSLAALFIAAYILPLGVRPLFVPDECRYAEIPREMLESGEWVVPRLDGVRYFEKPVLGYWLTGISMGALGQNNFAVRLPAALSAALTALAVFFLVRRFGGGVAHAAAAAMALLTSVMFFVTGCSAILDMPLTMFVSGGMVFFYFAYRAEGPEVKALHLALFGLCIGGAFLVKGFLALVIPCLIIVPFVLWERGPFDGTQGRPEPGRKGGGRGLFRLAWIPAAVAALLSAPWAILIHLREPDFWHYFIWIEHVHRFFSAHAQHVEPVWYFAPVILGAMAPWTVFLPAAVIGLRRRGLNDSFLRFALSWAVFPFLFFSLSRGKLETYILPCLPPLAALIVSGLFAYLEQPRRKLFNAGAWLLSGVLFAASAAVVVCGAVGISPILYAADEAWKWLILAGAALVWASLAMFAARCKRPQESMVLLLSGPWLVMAAAHFALPRSVEAYYTPAALLRRNAPRVVPQQPLFSRAGTVPATCWYYKRSDVGLLESRGELEYGLDDFSDAGVRVIRERRFAKFISGCAPETLVTVVFFRDYYDRKRADLPPPEFEDVSGGFVLAQYRGGARTPAPGRKWAVPNAGKGQ